MEFECSYSARMNKASSPRHVLLNENLSTRYPIPLYELLVREALRFPNNTNYCDFSW